MESAHCGRRGETEMKKSQTVRVFRSNQTVQLEHSWCLGIQNLTLRIHLRFEGSHMRRRNREYNLAMRSGFPVSLEFLSQLQLSDNLWCMGMMRTMMIEDEFVHIEVHRHEFVNTEFISAVFVIKEFYRQVLFRKTLFLIIRLGFIHCDVILAQVRRYSGATY